MMKEPTSGLGIGGIFEVEIKRQGTIVGTLALHNGAVYEGMSTLLNAGFAGGSGFSNLYLGLIKFLNPIATPTAIVTIGDTMASNGWLDFEFTEYALATRPEIVFTSTSSGRIGAPGLVFEIENGANLQGFFISTSSVKGGSAGTLWATAVRAFFTEGSGFLSAGSAESLDFVLLNGDLLVVSYGVSLSPIDT